MRILILSLLVALLTFCKSPNERVTRTKIDANLPSYSADLDYDYVAKSTLVANSVTNPPKQERFLIEVFRQSLNGNLITGTIGVNGQSIGPTFENNLLKIKSGSYPGFLRYISQKGHVQGPDGYLGDAGDFLLEIGNVTWNDGTKRTSLLFHGGNKPEHSQGCIMLGPVSTDAAGNRVLPSGHALRKLRTLFYGTNNPESSPNKDITIVIHDIGN